METKMCIFNDREEKMVVRIQNHNKDEVIESIDPGDCKVVQITLADHQVPFLKIWEYNHALLAGIDPCYFEAKGK